MQLVVDQGFIAWSGADNRTSGRKPRNSCSEARLRYPCISPPAAPRKFTRITCRNFQQPHTTELLWVYEGLTRYLNWVLAARSGIFTPQAGIAHEAQVL